MRTLISLLTTLSMLHLVLIGGDAACVARQAAGHAMPGMVMTGTARVDCATTSDARCCTAMTSCGVAASMRVVERPVSCALPVAATPTLPTANLESVLVAPEPPPPKA